MTRTSLTEHRRKAALTERGIAESIAQQKAERDAEWKAAKDAHKAAEAARVKFTRDEVLGARLVRTQCGWFKVIRVNQKTVTGSSLAGTWSWEERISFDRILQVAK